MFMVHFNVLLSHYPYILFVFYCIVKVIIYLWTHFYALHFVFFLHVYIFIHIEKVFLNCCARVNYCYNRNNNNNNNNNEVGRACWLRKCSRLCRVGTIVVRKFMCVGNNQVGFWGIVFFQVSLNNHTIKLGRYGNNKLPQYKVFPYLVIKIIANLVNHRFYLVMLKD